ncbi:MAG: hypothetical protein HPY83_03950 [Anaerolineae bacterium]|nr:hypothetical protein [Anaerolineae bacterium]
MDTEATALAVRRDRWASWAVVGLVIVALLLGWAVKAVAEGRTWVHEVDGLRIPYPAGWIRATADPPVLLQVEKLDSPARTTLTLQRRPVTADAASPLNAVHQALTLERGRTWTAYRVLEVEPSAAVAGREALRVTFAYVETNANPFLKAAPVVMLGEEYLFVVGQNVQVVTLTAAEANFDRALKDLHAFLRSSPK